MIILALDTSMIACSVACVKVNDASGEISVLASISTGMARGHAEALVPMIARAMSEAGVSFEALDRIAVANGPGSFTGLRVGIATARGLGLALDIPVVGVGTMDALAFDIVDANAATDRPFVVLLDARREQLYVQKFDAVGAPLGNALICDLTACEQLGDSNSWLAGSGAAVLADRGLLNFAHIGILDLPCPTGPTTRNIAVLASRAGDTAVPPSPLYLRPPDAKAQDHKSLARR